MIGESCNDEYHYGECRRLSPEAPVPVFDWKYSSVCPGMAANVKANLEAFGCQVDAITNDPKDLTKSRYVDLRSEHQLLRVDKGSKVHPLTIKDLLFRDFDEYDAIIFSDYDKGLIPWSIARSICINYSGKIFVDSKKTDLSCYDKSIIKINEFEEEQYSELPDDCELIVTLGKNGAKWNQHKFPAPSVNVYDVTGAGDVFLSTLSVFISIGESMENSIQKAILMASKSVQHSGTYQLQETDIKEIL